MAIVTGDRYLESLVKFVENHAEKLIEGSLVLKLNPAGFRYVQSRFEALGELESLLAGAPVDYFRAYVSDLGDHRALEQLRRILRLIPSLKVVSLLPPPRRDPTPLFLLPFGNLKVLELRGCDLSTSAAKGLLELRFTLEKLICHNSTDALRHVFASRIADIKDSRQWNRLSFVSCACNDLILMDESLQLLPMVEILDLSRNKFAKVDNLRKCTKLKHVDLGFNCLRSIALLSEVPCQIVKLVLRNNALTSLHGMENLKSLQGLDLSYNVISNFSEIEVLAGIPSLQSLWLEGNPLCYARWFRAKVFSLFPHPDLLKLDEKKISTWEAWKRNIIISGRQKEPTSFGFYSPIQHDVNVEGSENTKKQYQKRSRLAYIESDEWSIADQDSVSCDNEIESRSETMHTEGDAEIEGLITRIESLKKDHSALWFEEFQEWVDQTSENVADVNKFRNTFSRNNKDMHFKSETEDADHAEPSRYISDSFQFSGDESSTVILGSETSFADTSVVSAQQYFDRISEASSRLFTGHAVGDKYIFKNFNESQEELKSLNNEGTTSVDVGYLLCNSLEICRGDILNTEKIAVPSTAINDITGSHFSSACPASPPHYQEDILHRRHNLEEEFLQLSAETFSVASSDSNTSGSEDGSAQMGLSVSHIDHSVMGSSSQRSHDKFVTASFEDDSYHEKKSSSNQNGTETPVSCAEGNSATTGARDLEISLPGNEKSYIVLQDDESLGSVMGKTGLLEKNRVNRHRRKPSRRMISLPEEDGDTDSSRKSNEHFETC